MPYHHNDPLYQTSQSRVMSFHDFEKDKSAELEELKKMKRNFKKRGEMHQAPGERKAHYNPVTHKIEDMSAEEVEDRVEAMEEIDEKLSHSHSIQNYMFFANLKTICRLSRKLLSMDKQQLDKMLMEHNWALDHIATSKDDVEEVFNWVMSHHYDPESAMHHNTQNDR